MHCDPTLTVAQIPHKCLRAKRANTYCDSTLTAAQIPVKCFWAKRATTHWDPRLTAAQIHHKCPRAKRATTHCDPTLTAPQIPHKCLRAKRATMHCDPTLIAAQIHHKCLRAKGATTTLAFTPIQIFESHTENLWIFSPPRPRGHNSATPLYICSSYYTDMLYSKTRGLERRHSSPPWCQTPDDPLPCNPTE